MTHNKNYIPGTLLQFSPCIIFIILYTFLYTFFSYNHTSVLEHVLSGLPLFVVLVTTVYAFFTFKKSISIHEKIKIFFSGSINQSASYFYGTFIGATVFMHVLAKIGAIVTMVNIMTIVLPSHWILPLWFIMVIIFSVIIRSWTVSLILCIPIACGVAQFLQINPALMAATIVSGILCGYQMSMALGSITQYEKVKEIFWLVSPAAFFTLMLLSMYQYYVPEPLFFKILQSSLCLQDYISLAPIIIFFIAALLHLDLIINLVMVSSFSIVVGILQHKISNSDAIMFIFQGYYGQQEMVKLMLLCIFLSGLINIINYNHGFHYIIDAIKHKTKNMYMRQLIVMFIIALINAVIALDIVSINVLMPMMKKISDRYALSYQKSLALLYLVVTTTCCFLPYAPIILLTGYLSHAPLMQIIQYMFYPVILLLWIIISMLIGKDQKPSRKSFYHSGN